MTGKESTSAEAEKRAARTKSNTLAGIPSHFFLSSSSTTTQHSRRYERFKIRFVCYTNSAKQTGFRPGAATPSPSFYSPPRPVLLAAETSRLAFSIFARRRAFELAILFLCFAVIIFVIVLLLSATKPQKSIRPALAAPVQFYSISPLHPRTQAPLRADPSRGQVEHLQRL